MTLQEQIANWSREGAFDQIISAAEKVPKEELDLFCTCQLALAYNNTNRLQDTISLLMNIEEMAQGFAPWNFYLGYALLFSGRKEDALRRLLKARELDGRTPAESLLHHCICYDGTTQTPDQRMLLQWVCTLVNGELNGEAVVVPQYNLRIYPWFEQLQANDSNALANINFNLQLQDGTSLFECCVGIGKQVRDAVCAALGSFYLGIYSVLRNLYQSRRLEQIQDSGSRTWNVFCGEIVGMGNNPYVPGDYYWNLLQEAIPNYLSGRSLVCLKIFGSKNGDEITAECRVNDVVSHTLSKLLQASVQQWPAEGFASHKQFFLFSSEDTKYPYSQEQIHTYVNKAVALFCDPQTAYSEIYAKLAEYTGDADLADELYAFIPELCAARAFEKITFPDEIKIQAGSRKITCTSWQVTSYYMIDAALSSGFRTQMYPDHAFRDCVSVSSTFHLICQAKEDKGVDLAEQGGTVTHYFNFNDNYTLR